MESSCQTPVLVKSRGRPRKRRREDDDDNVNVSGNVIESSGKNEVEESVGNARKRGRPPKKRVEIKGEAMVGKYVKKEFEGSGVFLGKIVGYDSGLYRVDYEDGDFEDLDSGELRAVLVGNERDTFVGEWLERKGELDERLEKKSSVKKDEVKKEGEVKTRVRSRKRDCVKVEEKVETDVVETMAVDKVDEVDNGNVECDNAVKAEADIGNVESDVVKVEVPEVSEVPKTEGNVSGVDDGDDEYDDDSDSDSSSNWSEYGQGWEDRAETELPAIAPPELPPSSGNLGVPEEHVSHLFSVYGFLRSFSIRLFLSPFTLDDLVGCLNCTAPNTLLDSIHVALLRATRRHLESQASEGSQLASKCIRCIDWSLLDMSTWPVYLVHYLMVMGHLNGNEWKGFYTDVLGKDYFTLPVGTKLAILQILCDDALDTEAVKAEIDMREEAEVGIGFDGMSASSVDNGPMKVNTRSGKSSVVKDRGGGLDADNSHGLSKKESDTAVREEDDENLDECRLCGMEGMLLCCDGCPSAYHSRCIGVNKLSIPEGVWYCPECTISKLGPAITAGTSFKGADVFGVDPYAQLFVGTCSHLLVLKVSVKTSSFLRYYSYSDIRRVVAALCSSPNHAVTYLEICQAILKYWELPQDILYPFLRFQATAALESKEKEIMQPTQFHLLGENGSQSIDDKVKLGNFGSSISESFGDDTKLPGTSGSSIFNSPANLTSTLSNELSQGLVGGLSKARIATCSSEYSSSTGAMLNSYGHGKGFANGAARINGKWKDSRKFMGSQFKPFAYINQYVHGEFAASAAANFASLTSDENRASEIHSSDPRKAMAANNALQVKAFSAAAVRFFWPSTEKKLMEIPRERCSWCLHCKAPVTSRKACLLNQAAMNATRVAMKYFSGIRLVKNVEGALYGIAAYILYMEESLRGLILGPFQTVSYRELWRKRVEQVSNCSDLKALLLQLEGNLSAVALSSEWSRLVDHWMDDSSVPQSGCPAGSVQKKGPGRRKKQVTVAEVTGDDSNDNAIDFIWWRGGKMAKLVFQRGILPCAVLKKAARQGGSRKIAGIYYADGSDVPKRSRQFIWRAAVETAQNSSRLALQVRYLDHHIKWSDLVRPEQNLQDGKGPETDAVAFRNARICDKKIMENKVIYGVVFGIQKHLSTRLMKSVIDKEEGEDGKDKYWFQETRIPLYLVKEYEESVERIQQLSAKEPDSLSELQKKQMKAARKNIFCFLTRKRDGLSLCPCASCHKDVWIKEAAKCIACEGYCHKRCIASSTVQTSEDTEYMTACQRCLRRKGVTQISCSVESPTSPLAVQVQEFRSSAPVSKITKLKITSQQHNNSASAARVVKQKASTQQLSSTPVCLPDKKPVSTDSNLSKNKKRPTHLGLVWKKKESDDDGSEFRLRNILFKDDVNAVDTKSIECFLCHKPYDQKLMYIHCDTCSHWYHADAVALDESKISNLIGFKCCRCRRIKSPVCPYDPNPKKVEVKKIRIKGPKEEPAATSSVSEAVSEQAESVPSTPFSPMDEDLYIEVDDPLLLSVSEGEQMPEPQQEVDFDWNTSVAPIPQKLPVRRHIRSEKDDDDACNWTDSSLGQLPASFEMKNVAEWDVSNDALPDGAPYEYGNFNFDNADFEPQTYFSFTELLDAEDGNQLGGVDAPLDGWENLTCENSRTGFIDDCEIVPLQPAIDYCSFCSQTTPAPDLSCQNCGLQIHSQCSPWEEYSQGGSWSCGHCRGWK